MSRLRSLIVASLALALLATTPPSNYCISRATLVAQVTAGQLTWKTSAPSGWSTDNTMVTWTDFTNQIQNSGSCVQPAGSAFGLMSWGQMIACATNHVASQQNQAFTGSYSTIYYNTTYNSQTQLYTCHGPYGSDGYTGTPVTLPAGTVAPTSSGTQLSLTISSITWYAGKSTSLSISLYNPSGTIAEGPYTVNTPTTSYSPPAYYATGAAAGAWYWQITQSGATDGTCDNTSGSHGGGTQVQWSGTAYFYE